MPTTPLEHDYIGLGGSSSSSPPSTSSSSWSSDEKEKQKKTNSKSMKETELRLGLPGCDERKLASLSGKDMEERSWCVKRGFCDLKWVGNSGTEADSGRNNKPCVSAKDDKKPHQLSSDRASSEAQVVGWPPIRSFRKNLMALNSPKIKQGTDDGLYVKVSMDGAPYLRKVDLLTCKTYIDLTAALENMFRGFTLGKCGSTRLHGSEYVVTYEDKDMDWMLVGDVPWEMFIYTCRRLRIMKGSEANGLAPS